MPDNAIAFGPFVFDRDRLSVTRDGEHTSLGSHGSALLNALLEAGSALVGKDKLLGAAWPGTIVEESNLTVQIALLRKALGTRPDGQEWIVTVPRVGYRLIIPAAAPYPLAAEPAVLPGGKPLIAALPFLNLSSDAEQGYFADGVEPRTLARRGDRPLQSDARKVWVVGRGRYQGIRRHSLGQARDVRTRLRRDWQHQ